MGLLHGRHKYIDHDVGASLTSLPLHLHHPPLLP